MNKKRYGYRLKQEYYLDCSACGDLQDSYNRPDQAKDAIYKHQTRGIETENKEMPGLFVRHRVTVRLRKDD